jgi:pimeloyl-ACP methyl ester carboxylesterase
MDATLQDCRLEGFPFTARCGIVEVFEDGAARRGRRIALRVVVLPAQQPFPGSDPLFYLAGGPGLAATEESRAIAPLLAELAEARPVVLVDLRGTGGSNALTCPRPLPLAVEAVAPAAIDACRHDLEARADLRLYTTALAMDDLDEVRAALGYARIDLLGESYGGLAAQVYLHRHGDRARAAVLLSPVAPGSDVLLSYAADAQRALDLLFDDCAAQPRCKAAFPDLRRELKTVLDRLAQKPLRVELPGEPTRDGAPASPASTLEMTRERFAATLRMRLYSERAAVRVPRAVHRAYRGDFADMAHAASRLGSFAAGLSEGLFLSVSSAEGLAGLDPVDIRRRAAGTFLGPEPLLARESACRGWPRGDPAGAMEPVHSPVPMLLLSGRRDPVTPPSQAASIARGLPNSRHLVLPTAHHALDHPCLTRLIAAFLANPEPAALETACLSAIVPLPFELDPPSSTSPRPHRP